MTARRSRSWVVVRAGGAELACLRCGVVERVELPIPVRRWAKRAAAFGEAHDGCAEPAPALEGAR